MTEFVLKSELMKISEHRTWDVARREWILEGTTHLDRDEPPESCLCGHYPIKNLCHLKNILNGHETIVGNCCIDKVVD